MAIVTEISWDDMLDGKPLPETPARQAWREAVAEIADKAQEPSYLSATAASTPRSRSYSRAMCNCWRMARRKVASQSNGTTVYHVVNGHCDCQDFAKAPQQLCKHRLSAAIARRAQELIKAKLADTNGQAEPPAPASTSAA